MIQFKEAAKHIENNLNMCYAGVDLSQKELFVLHYSAAGKQDCESGFVCLQYEAEGSFASYAVLEQEELLLKEHPAIKEINSFEISERTRINLMDKLFSYQVEILAIE